MKKKDLWVSNKSKAKQYQTINAFPREVTRILWGEQTHYNVYLVGNFKIAVNLNWFFGEKFQRTKFYVVSAHGGAKGV